ncbi:hypothetical protein Cni_G11393 [Canna indica]|uniref:Uncharacterized protein n=1 Tax=Canna indica TaxID=4628 RepID=A0AAQ3K7Q6_9LILI|nr:hypothetical protein Cni_G11393 [Canna indica]
MEAEEISPPPSSSSPETTEHNRTVGEQMWVSTVLMHLLSEDRRTWRAIGCRIQRLIEMKKKGVADDKTERPGLHISPRYWGESTLIDEKDEAGEDGLTSTIEEGTYVRPWPEQSIGDFGEDVNQ